MSLSSKRFLALDVFRGITVCFMIIVNTPGNGASTFSPLLHADWHGFTPTDLVFPSFLFAVGNAMSFAIGKWTTLPQSKVLAKIFRRSLIIFVLGYLLYWFPFIKWDTAGNLVAFPISETRVFGVLQRIALAYCIASLMIYYLKPKLTVILSVIFLLVYWLLLMWFGDVTDPLSLTGNAVLHLDKWLLGENHLYHGEGLAFDPEGLLSTLPAIVNVTAGYVTGKYVQLKGKTYEGLTIVLLSGFALMTIGYFWDLMLPINKKLWTSSFVVYTVGLDCVILAAIIYIIDILHKTKWTYFFEVFGRNPLFIYLLSELLAVLLYFFRVNRKTSVFNWTYTNIFSRAGSYFGSLLFAICFMLFCWLIGYVLDKRKLYVRV